MVVLRFLLFLFLLFLVVHGRNNCETSFCRNNGLPIRFPFRLTSQPQDCGYPGFDLTCNSAGVPVLNLPYSGLFLVREIDYVNQQIELYDPFGCIQSRLLKLNLSSSPFQAVYYRNYTFITCPPADALSLEIRCLSNVTNYTLAAPSASYAGILSHRCQITDTRPIAVPRLYEYSWSSRFSLLDDDLLLKWDAPYCKICELRSGVCGFKNSTSQGIQCSIDPGEDLARRRAIIWGIIIPITVCSICILYYKLVMSETQHSLQVNARAQNSMATTVTELVPHVARGLDDSTIESYATVILGESRRIPGPNSTTCPICLADYLPKDTLRSIPECEHCFHGHCIDEWLRLKSICPVCRKSPSSACVGS